MDYASTEETRNQFTGWPDTVVHLFGGWEMPKGRRTYGGPESVELHRRVAVGLLAKHRRDSGLSQHEVAEYMKCGQSAVSQLETGANVRNDSMVLYLDIVGYPDDWSTLFSTALKAAGWSPVGGWPQETKP